jgi:hypothetical protein
VESRDIQNQEDDLNILDNNVGKDDYSSDLKESVIILQSEKDLTHEEAIIGEVIRNVRPEE